MYVSGFRSLTPTHVVPQTQGLSWLASAHARSGTELPAAQIEKLLARFGCGPDKIETRGTFLSDFTHTDWARMQIFSEPGPGADLDHRMAFFKEILQPAVDGFYSEAEPAFKNWIHVTCTGYSSPSVIQNIVSRRGWGAKVEVLHAYHMGCYAALPALRMARGLEDTEILHTELCTLHLNPAKHEPEQLVIQSLFADGVIAYRASNAKPADGFAIEELREWIVPESLHAMTWDVAAGGFQMTLAREVPKILQESIASLIGPWQTPDTVYAIHPGGPRIIDAVAAALGLSEEQVHFSRQVLRRHGNMSSATLPHVWRDMLSEIPEGAPVISLAFGPGLTLAASKMRRVRG